MTINGGRRTLQDRRLPELSGSKRIAKARTSNRNTTFSTESAEPGPTRAPQIADRSRYAKGMDRP
jgi:hypothetical protein